MPNDLSNLRQKIKIWKTHQQTQKAQQFNFLCGARLILVLFCFLSGIALVIRVHEMVCQCKKDRWAGRELNLDWSGFAKFFKTFGKLQNTNANIWNLQEITSCMCRLDLSHQPSAEPLFSTPTAIMNINRSFFMFTVAVGVWFSPRLVAQIKSTHTGDYYLQVSEKSLFYFAIFRRS